MLTPDVDDGYWCEGGEWGGLGIFQAEGWPGGGREGGEPRWDPVSPEK